MEDGNFRLSTRFLEHCPIISPPTNQKKVTHPAALTPNFAYKTSPHNMGEFGFFEHKPPILFAWPCNKPFSAPNSYISVCLVSLWVQHRNFCLETICQTFSIVSCLVFFSSSLSIFLNMNIIIISSHIIVHTFYFFSVSHINLKTSLVVLFLWRSKRSICSRFSYGYPTLSWTRTLYWKWMNLTLFCKASLF